MIRLAVSNLAWPTDCDEDAFQTLARLGVQGIEVAPTRLAPWNELTPARLAAYRARVQDCGLAISSLQAILFGTENLALLGDRARFDALLLHLNRVADIAAALGAGVLVFGSPRNRLRGDRTAQDAWSLARDRWREIGEMAHAAGIVVGIEPVPAFYGGDFLLTWQDVLRMVREVDQAGVRVHLDTGCVALGGGDIAEAVTAARPWLVHFHAAQPGLDNFSEPLPGHAAAAAALRAAHYDGWIAIEMREQPSNPLHAALDAVRSVQSLYDLNH